MSEATGEIREKVQQLVPQFLFIRCPKCKRVRKFQNLHVEIHTDEKRGRIGTVVGNCGKCGEESRESIHTEEERSKLAARSIRYHEREQRRLQKKQQQAQEKKSNMALKIAKKKTAKAEKATTKNRKVAAEKSTKSSKKTAASDSGERTSHWVRKEGQPNGTQTLAMIFAGGPWTIEEAQKRHDQMAKKGMIARRLKPIGTIDGTWLTKRPNGINVDGKKYEAYRSLNADGEDVFTVPDLPDPLVSGAKKLKTKESGDKLMLGKMVLVKDVKELKGEKPAAKKSEAKATKKSKK